MRIIRTVTKPRTMASYSQITTATAHRFMLQLANAEASRKSLDVQVEGGELSGNSRAKLVDDGGNTVATYSQVW